MGAYVNHRPRPEVWLIEGWRIPHDRSADDDREPEAEPEQAPELADGRAGAGCPFWVDSAL
jgi:hypothetical protein